MLDFWNQSYLYTEDKHPQRANGWCMDLGFASKQLCSHRGIARLMELTLISEDMLAIHGYVLGQATDVVFSVQRLKVTPRILERFNLEVYSRLKHRCGVNNKAKTLLEGTDGCGLAGKGSV